MAWPSTRRLAAQTSVSACRRARANAGRSKPISTAITPMTTSNSTSVKARLRFVFCAALDLLDMAASATQDGDGTLSFEMNVNRIPILLADLQLDNVLFHLRRHAFDTGRGGKSR